MKQSAKNASRSEGVSVDRVAHSVEETAQRLGISVASIYRRIEDGTLKTIKIGGRRLIPIESERALLAGQS